MFVLVSEAQALSTVDHKMDIDITEGTLKELDNRKIPFSHIDERLSILCTKCEDYVDIRNIKKHRELHRVFKIFRCNFESKPKTLKQLLKKRRQIINDAMSKANSDRPVPAKTMQKIDWSFEILKNEISNDEHDVMGSQQEGLKRTYQVSGRSEKLENIGLSFGVCQCQNENWRTENEDRFTFNEGIIGQTEYGFFGLFDGYNGVTASEKCSEYFEKFLIEEISLGDNNTTAFLDDATEEMRNERENFIKQAIKKSFSKMDHHLLHGESETSKHRWSGVSATICYIENETLYVGNVGDVRALYVKGDGDAVSLGEDHILRNKKERDRIKKSNGSVSIGTKSALVNGLVSSTRGLGNHGDPNLRSSVICKPKIDVVRIEPEDQFVISFTAGIWEVFSDEEVMFLLEDIMPDTSGIENLRQHFQSLAVDSERKENGLGKRIFGQEAHESFQTIQEEALTKHNGEGSGTILGDTHPMEEEKTSVVEKVNEEISKVESSDVDEEQKNTISVKMNEVWLKRDATVYKEGKACFLARALVERLAHAALLAGSRENITAAVILFSGCPVNLYLLPSVKRKSVVQREWKKAI